MLHLSITSVLVISLYFILTIWLGYFRIREPRNMREYGIGNSTKFALIATFIATSAGAGSIVGDMKRIAEDGIIFVAAMSGFLVFCLYMIKFVAPKFDHRFSGMISAADIINKFYGSKAAKLSAIIGLISSTITVAAQTSALAYMFSGAFGPSYKAMVLLSLLIIVLYSYLRGIDAVVKTDILQFFIIVAVIPFMCVLLIIKAGGITQIISSIPLSKTLIISHPKFLEYLSLFIVGSLPFLWLHPPLIQRFLMARDTLEIVAMYKVSFFVRVALTIILIPFMSFAILSLFPDTDTNLLFGTLLSDILSPGVGAIFIICVLAASMSTIDSYMNTASILFAHNLMNLSSDKAGLLAARLSILAIGLFSGLIALIELDVVTLAFLSFSIWGSSVTIPMLGGITNCLSPKSVNFWLCFCLSSISTFCSIFFIDIGNMSSAFISIIAGLIGYCLPYLITANSL